MAPWRVGACLGPIFIAAFVLDASGIVFVLMPSLLPLCWRSSPYQRDDTGRDRRLSALQRRHQGLRIDRKHGAMSARRARLDRS